LISTVVISSGLLIAGVWSLSSWKIPAAVHSASAVAAGESSPAELEDTATNRVSTDDVAKQELLSPLSSSSSSAAALPQRTWTDLEGRQVVAMLVGYRNGRIDLRTDDGRVASIPLTTLCEEDRVFLWNLAGSQSGELRLFQPRVWSASKNGSVVEAAALQFDEETIQLLRRDGRIFTVARSTFGQSDQSYLQSLTSAL
jgi:hypothetical protein